MRSILRRLQRRANGELNHLAYNWQTIGSPGRAAVFQIELTNNCPMTCEMCPRTHSMTRPLGYMERGLYERIVEEAAASSGKVFLHHFGDSLLHPDLGEYIGFARAHGVGTYLSANPVLLTDSRVRALVDNGLEELVLSLDGLTAETSALVRGPAASNVELAERRIHSLLAYRAEQGVERPEVVLQMVRQKQNMHEVEAWLEKWRAVEGLDRVKVKSYVTWDGREEAINRLRPDEQEDRDPGVVCDKPWTSVTVLWDGTVVPCCFDHNGSLALGRLGEQSLAEIWRGERLASLRRAHRSGDLSGVSLCEQCTDREGYPVRKWYYPLNRWFRRADALGDEWEPPACQR